MSLKAKRKSLTVEKKLKLLIEVDKGRKKKDICVEFGILKTTLSTIQKNRAQYECTDLAPSGKKLQGAKHSDVDKALLIWMRQALAMGTPVNGPLLKTKANNLAQSLGITDWA